MRTRLLVLWLNLGLVGCSIGPSAGGFHPATGPAGISVELKITRDRSMVGELLEVRDTALLILADSAVWLAPFRAIQSASFRQRSNLDFGVSWMPGQEQRDRMRLLARFPSGLTPDLLQQLLKAHGQLEPRAVP